MNTHYEGKKHTLYTIEFINQKGQHKKIKFMNPHKAGNFYTQIKADPTTSHVKKTKTYITAQQLRIENELKKQTLEARHNAQ